jgi:hypothetical protein
LPRKDELAMKRAGWCVAAAVLSLAVACTKTGPYVPDRPGALPEDQDGVVLLDSGLRRDVAVTGQTSQKTEDGRLWIRAQILNRTEDQLWVQVQTEFKDASGFSYGDVTPWEYVRLERSSSTPYSAKSLNTKAEHFTIRVKYPND